MCIFNCSDIRYFIKDNFKYLMNCSSNMTIILSVAKKKKKKKKKEKENKKI